MPYVHIYTSTFLQELSGMPVSISYIDWTSNCWWCLRYMSDMKASIHISALAGSVMYVFRTDLKYVTQMYIHMYICLNGPASLTIIMSHTSQLLGICSAINTALQEIQSHSVFEPIALIANAYSRQSGPCSSSPYPRDLVYACAAPSCVSARDRCSAPVCVAIQS